MEELLRLMRQNPGLRVRHRAHQDGGWWGFVCVGPVFKGVNTHDVQRAWDAGLIRAVDGLRREMFPEAHWHDFMIA